MANLRKVARQDARRYGLDPSIFARQINQESGFNPSARSGAGARGIAQIMPGTAAGWGVNPDDPIASLDAAAKHMAQYVKQYGSYRNALVAYNAGPGRVGGKLPAETVNYISKILGGHGGSGPRSTAVAPGATTGTRYTPATTKTDEGSAAVDALLAHAQSPGSSLLQGFVRNLDSGLYTTHTPASKTTYSLPGVTGPPGPSSHIRGSVGGSPLAGVKPHGATHETSGLPGFPAYDYMGKAGTPVVAPVSGKIVKLSGHDPKAGPTDGPHGPFGWSVYVQGDDGRTYYLTHLGSRNVRVGQRVKQGTAIGTIGNYAKYGGANHVHMGVHVS